MKPSFLRKQKYTIQECHSRGRKNLRKGLKFHNFLPSESVTSEKDSGYLNSKWKVHSECRLREEHGTKQITISNWSQSVQTPPTEASNYSVSTNLPAASSVSESPESSVKDEDDGSDPKSNASDPYDFNLSLQQNSPESISMPSKSNRNTPDTIQNSPASTSKKESLNFVLNSLLEKPAYLEKKSDSSDETENHNKGNQKHRRKPVQTRRVVPYVKYLSIMEENETLPLDLSSKCLINSSPTHSVSSGEESKNISWKNDLNRTSPPMCDKNPHSNYVTSSENLQVPNIPTKKLVNSSLDRVMSPQLTTPITVLYPVPVSKNANLGQNGFHPASFQEPGNSKIEINANQNVNNPLNIPMDKSYSLINPPFSNAFSVQKSFIKEVQSKPRRRNQRSVIKQKLEDTFRQNGFLVKTKQVSDGEATFCKFRQLRKYTRYYLKSLEQHLPDEFHKMWKGFLPPKTVLPPALGASESSTSESI